MHVVVRNVGQRIVVSADTIVTVLAIRDGAVLFGIEATAATQPQEAATAIATHEDTAARRPSDD